MLTRITTWAKSHLLARRKRCELKVARRRMGLLQSDLVMAQAAQLFNTERINELRIRLDAARRVVSTLEKQQ